MNTFLRLTTCTAILILAACSAPTPTASPTEMPTEVPVVLATQPPSPTNPAPVATDVPLLPQATFETSSSSESGKAPDYTLKTAIPVLQGSDPRIQKFNHELMAEVIQPAIDQFRKDLAMQPAAPIAGGSFLDLHYELISPPGNNIISLQIQMDGMSDGAAHPYHVTLSFNYDLQKGEQITLKQLFLHGVNPLKTIADYCKAELGKRDIGFQGFEIGAEPTNENYAVWNLSSDGLVIFFNEYQVAAYAAGPQSVTIPLDKLSSIIDPAGPLAGWKP